MLFLKKMLNKVYLVVRFLELSYYNVYISLFVILIISYLENLIE